MIWMQLSPRSRQSVLFSFCWLVSDWLQVWNLFFADLFNDLLVNWSLSLVCTWFSFSNMDFFSFVLVFTGMQLEDGRTLSDYNTPAVGGRAHFVGLKHSRRLLPLAGAIRYIGSSSIHFKIADMTDILPQHKHMQNLTTQEPAWARCQVVPSAVMSVGMAIRLGNSSMISRLLSRWNVVGECGWYLDQDKVNYSVCCFDWLQVWN